MEACCTVSSTASSKSTAHAVVAFLRGAAVAPLLLVDRLMLRCAARLSCGCCSVLLLALLLRRLSPGQFCYVNVPWISHSEWHPFSVMPEIR